MNITKYRVAYNWLRYKLIIQLKKGVRDYYYLSQLRPAVQLTPHYKLTSSSRTYFNNNRPTTIPLSSR